MASLHVLLLLVCASLSTHVSGISIGLTRIHSNPDVSASEFVRGALRRDMYRFGGVLAGGTVAAPTQKSAEMGEYLMMLAIGTPPLAYPAIADTGSNLIWTQCAPCGSQCFPQPVPVFDPSSSSTFSVLPCNSSRSMCAATTCPSQGYPCTYNYTYGSGWTAGIQGVETFTFGSTPADQAVLFGVSFGCSNASSDNFNGSAGIVGLGRGSNSLVSQLGAGMFSYCLTPFQDTNSTSTLLLGPSAALNDAEISSTPLVPSPPTRSHYYLNLTGISVGATLLSIPSNAFSQRTDGTGGLIIDSGTTITYLVDAAYQPVRAAVQSLVTLPLVNGTGLDLCFQLPSMASTPPAMPSMTFHFDGADMVLPADNYMWLLASNIWCLAMSTQNLGVSIFGNYMQQNMHILYDVQNEMLSFAPAKCSTL